MATAGQKVKRKPPRAGMGRPKGSKNKVTTAFKQAVLLTYGNIGGDAAFAAWAGANPTEFYKIAARLIPTETTTTVDGTVEIRWKS